MHHLCERMPVTGEVMVHNLVLFCQLLVAIRLSLCSVGKYDAHTRQINPSIIWYKIEKILCFCSIASSPYCIVEEPSGGEREVHDELKFRGWGRLYEELEDHDRGCMA